MGRTAAGVRGISLREDDEVVSMEILDEGDQVLHVTNKGVGKRTPEEQYRVTRRGGKGIFTCKISKETGHVVAVKSVNGEEDIMLITVAGVLIRIPVEEIAQTGRNTQGVRLIRIQDDEEVATVAKIDAEEEELDEEDNDVQNESIDEESDNDSGQEKSDAANELNEMNEQQKDETDEE